ncbi:MAG: AAA family ATPase [Gemmatimonadetes bacterium]|nr:AAA family ATPase [Gemmatimonadota bacterium]
METLPIRSAVISTDEAFRATVREVLQRPDQTIGVALELNVAFTQFGDGHLRDLRSVDPELIILDLETDPVLGIKFAQFLTEQSPGRRILATGPTPSSEQLLSALRAGISEYLPKPVTREALSAAIDGLSRKLRWSGSGGPNQPGKLFAVFSGKGGSGSTTVATNLAIYLHQLTGRRTLLVDLDLELGEIALQLGAEPRFNFIDMVRNFHRMDADLLASFIEHHSSGVHLLSAPYHPQKTEVVVGDQIARILRFLKQHYDYVIVDTSKSFSPPTLATFEEADQIFLVTTVDVPSLRNIARCLPLLTQMASPADERLRLVLNRYIEDGMIRIPDVERTLGMKVYHTIGNDYEAIVRSINSGIPIILDRESKYAHDLRALGAIVSGMQMTAAPTGGTLSRSLVEPLSRMWRKNFVREVPK